MKTNKIFMRFFVYAAIFSAAACVYADEDPVHRDLGRAKSAVAEEPWLRINAGGHTATVQALAFTPDSERLCSAGLDKDVLVWNLSTLRDLKRTFLRERTIRWQVARGLRGSIYALASAPNDGLLAIGGYGAMGSLGDILLVDPVKGTLVKVLEGHQQTVCSLAFSPDGKRLVSCDTSGRVLLWNRDGEKPAVIRDSFEKVYGRETNEYLARHPVSLKAVFLGNHDILVPVVDGSTIGGVLLWRIYQYDANDPSKFVNLEQRGDVQHMGMVTALAAMPDGKRFASADLEGSLFIWHKGGEKGLENEYYAHLITSTKAKNSSFSSKDRGDVIISLSFRNESHTLMAGTVIDPTKSKSRLEFWDGISGKFLDSKEMTDHIHSCAFSPNGKWFAYVGGVNNEIFIEKFNEPISSVKPFILSSSGQKVFKVAFAAREPLYRVAFGTEFHDYGFNNAADLKYSFDTEKLALGDEQKFDKNDWLPNDWLAGGWKATPQNDGSLALSLDGEAKCTVKLGEQLPHFDDGRIRCYCWIPDENGKPFAIAVGTDRQNSVYVCKLAEKGTCPVLRHFRGHNDYLTSLGVSRDLKYLVSGSADGTVRIWSLAELAQGATPSGRWGVEFAVDAGQLVAKKVHPAGPLYHKGLRDGDAIKEIRWPAESDEKAESDPEKMLAALRDMPWATQVVFAPTRGGKERPRFQLLPAWQPLATLFASKNREWAFWTPSGYYDASVNGYRLFGWQVNRGLKKLPDFYRADQFFKTLERPDMMEHLLSAGSLQGAFKMAATASPPQLDEALRGQIAATPKVEILSPEAGATVKETSMRVRARIEVPSDRKLLQSKVFANGVVGKNQQLISSRDVESGKELTYEWDVSLPRDKKNLIQVSVGTDAPTAAFGDVLVDRIPAPEKRSPKLYIVALGINNYGDPNITPLAFPVADAEAVVGSLRDRSKGLYALDDVALLTDKQVTPGEFRSALEKLGKKLQSVAQPDDLLLFFLAGHGVMDEKTKKYYFIGHDFKVEDLESGKYDDCISWDDFRELADVPCRKLALLDTCHSGAIQPPRSSDLKSAVRQLQDDVIFTVTASTGEQRSAEKQSWGHGAFTKCLLDALGGKADAAGSGYVTLDELVDYLRRAVPDLTEGLQTPTAAPDDILPLTALPLTKTAFGEDK